MIVPAVFGTSLANRCRPLYWVIADSVLLASVAIVHTVLEPPSHVYTPWTNRSNLLEAESKVAGGVATGVLFALLGSFSGQLVSNIIDGRKYGFTLKRRRTVRSDVNVSLMPAPSGAVGGASWSF